MNNPDDFLHTEYKCLRSEVEHELENMRKSELYAAGGIAAWLGWAFRHADCPLSNWLQWGAPFALSLIFSFRLIMHYLHFARLKKYLGAVEDYFLKRSADVPCGWEHFPLQAGASIWTVRNLLGSRLLFWLIAMVYFAFHACR